MEAAHREGRDASYLGLVVRVVDLDKNLEIHNGVTGMLSAHDVATGRFVVTLSSGQTLKVGLRNVQVVSVHDEDDQIQAAVHANRLRGEKERKKAHSEDLIWSSVQLLATSPCPPTSQSPAAKLMPGARRHVRDDDDSDIVPLSRGSKDRPPKLQKRPWESAGAVNFERSPLLRRSQWPPRPVGEDETSLALAKEREEQAKLYEAKERVIVGFKVLPAKTAKLQSSEELPLSKIYKSAVKLWEDNGMPYDSGLRA